MRDGRIEVTGPVTAKVGPVHLRLFPYELIGYEGDASDERPWAWGALCRITFYIGELSTTKRVTKRYAYCDRLGYPRQSRPSDVELAAGRASVLAELRTQIERHGIPAYDFNVVETMEISDGLD